MSTAIRAGATHVLVLGSIFCLAQAADEPAAPEPLDQLTIIAPSISGGGWDLTAQAMKEVLEHEGIARSVEVIRSPGAGGLIGLAQFSASRRGDGHSLLVGGLFMLGAAARNDAEISILDTTPIARLTEDHAVVAVPVASPYRDLGDLLEAMQMDTGAMRWVGGSAGGPDQLVVWQLAHAAGVDPDLMHYQPIAGGSEVAAQLAQERFVAGVSSYSEFDAALREGKLRALAISSPQRIRGVDVPTFEELGVLGISFSNWRGVFAPPEISGPDEQRLEAAIRRMVESPQWQEMLEHYHWESAYLSAPEFAKFIEKEQQRVVKSDPFAGGILDAQLLPSAKARRLVWAIALAAGIVLLLVILLRQRISSQRREGGLRLALQEASQDVERRTKEMEERAKDAAIKLAGMSAQIEREFDRWALTSAERSIAHLMLKGLRLKDIARARNTSDRTVRQQAQAIYRKAGIDGRSDLAAYFLEDILAPADFSAPAKSEPTNRVAAKREPQAFETAPLPGSNQAIENTDPIVPGTPPPLAQVVRPSVR